MTLRAFVAMVSIGWGAFGLTPARASADPTPPQSPHGHRTNRPHDPKNTRSRTSAETTDEGGEKVKVLKFSGLEISGKLKSPQLLYFLNRMRTEFDRPRLPHRSFMPELERSTKGDSF